MLSRRKVRATAPTQVAAFVEKLRSSGRIPLPGQVGVVMGGPPCQGVSGLNRQARHERIFVDDPRCAHASLRRNQGLE